MGDLLLKVPPSPPWPGANFRSDDYAHGGRAASFTQPTSNRQPPNRSGVRQRLPLLTSRSGKRQKKTHRHALWNAHTVIEKGTNGQACTSHTRRHCCSAPIRATLHFIPLSNIREERIERRLLKLLAGGDPKKIKVQPRTETFFSKKCVCVEPTRIVSGACASGKRFFQPTSLSYICKLILLKSNCAKLTLAHLHSRLCFSLFDSYHSGAALGTFQIKLRTRKRDIGIGSWKLTSRNGLVLVRPSLGLAVRPNVEA